MAAESNNFSTAKAGVVKEQAKSNDDIINLLWTGGWDSTYRLLDLILVQKKTVQPYYVRSSVRQSSELEIQTMEKIRHMLFEAAPHSRSLLLQTIYKNAEDIRPNDVITQQYKRLAAAKHLGNQYDYLARFADEAGIYNLELSIHKDDHAQKFLQDYITIENKDKGTNYRLQDKPSYEDLNLFKYFRFPILDLTKLDMEKMAASHNFLDLMNKTVFCHNPLKNGKPCGSCNPCRYTIKEGLGWRVPLSRRIRYTIVSTIKPPAKKLLKLLKLR